VVKYCRKLVCKKLEYGGGRQPKKGLGHSMHAAQLLLSELVSVHRTCLSFYY
jgi:hypothetical protein